MHYEYHEISPQALEDAKNSHLLSVDGLSSESVIARFYLLSYMKTKYGFYPSLSKDAKGSPVPFVTEDAKTFAWSLSHSESYVAFLLGESECGIDIAEIKERSPSLFRIHASSEYEILGGENWIHFYLLWTAKEALIKKCSATLDDMAKIQLKGKDATGYSFEFHGETHSIASKQDRTLIISYTL